MWYSGIPLGHVATSNRMENMICLILSSGMCPSNLLQLKSIEFWAHVSEVSKFQKSLRFLPWRITRPRSLGSLRYSQELGMAGASPIPISSCLRPTKGSRLRLDLLYGLVVYPWLLLHMNMTALTHWRHFLTPRAPTRCCRETQQIDKLNCQGISSISSAIRFAGQQPQFADGVS